MSENKFYPSCLSTQEIEKILKAAGIQATAQRLAICRYVLCEASHCTVEEVKDWADKNFPKISLATVYNTLNILVEVGLIKALKLSHSEKVIYDNNINNHYHFLDENTGELFDIDESDFKFNYSLGKDFKVNTLDVLIRGTKV
jgi:Fur family iron response transcriptional regulator